MNARRDHLIGLPLCTLVGPQFANAGGNAPRLPAASRTPRIRSAHRD